MDKTILSKIEGFFAQFKTQTYRKGEILIRADEDPSGIFYLTQGTVKMYAISKKGDEQILNIFKPVSFFPMSWAVNGTHNTYFFEAMTPLVLRKSPKSKALEFIKSNNDVLFDLLCRVYKGTDGLLERLDGLMSGNAYTQLLTQILINTKRFGTYDGKGATLKITEKDLASESGLTRETVSREIKLLKEQKLIDFSKNKLTVFSPEKLEDTLFSV